MSQLKFLKVVNELPPILEADAVYFVKQGANVRGFITDNSGTPQAYPITPELVDYALAVHTHPNATHALPGFMSATDKVVVDRLHALKLVEDATNNAYIFSNFLTNSHKLFNFRTGDFVSVPGILMYEYQNSNTMLVNSPYKYWTTVKPYDLPIELGRGMKVPLFRDQIFRESWGTNWSTHWDRVNIAQGTTVDVMGAPVPIYVQRNGVTGVHSLFEKSTISVDVGDRFAISFLVGITSNCTIQISPSYGTTLPNSYININLVPYGTHSVGSSVGDFEVTINQADYLGNSRVTIVLPPATVSGISNIAMFNICSADNLGYRPTELGTSTIFASINGIMCSKNIKLFTHIARYGPATGELVHDLNTPCLFESQIVRTNMPWASGSIQLILQLNDNVSSVANVGRLVTFESEGKLSLSDYKEFSICVSGGDIIATDWYGNTLTSATAMPNIVQQMGGTLNIIFKYGPTCRLFINGTLCDSLDLPADPNTIVTYGGYYVNTVMDMISTGYIGSLTQTQNMLDFNMHKFAVYSTLPDQQLLIMSGVV